MFKELYLTAFAVPDMREVLSIVELGKFSASPEHGAQDKDQEIKVNMLLGFAAGVCSMRELKLISDREIKRFTYFFLVHFHSSDVQTYCRFLQRWETERTRGIHLRPYGAWVDYCIREFKPPDFFEAKSQG